MDKIKDLAADCLLIDEYDEDEDGDSEDANK